MHRAHQVPSRVNVHCECLTICHAYEKRILLVPNPLKLVRFPVHQRLAAALRLNGKDWTSLQKASSVRTSDQTAHEIDADIFLPWNAGGERNACKQMFDEEAPTDLRAGKF